MDEEAGVSELPAAVLVAVASELTLTFTAKLPLHGGVPDAFTPRKRCPGASTLSSRPLPIRTGTP